MRTAREWNRAAAGRLRMIHQPSGTAGNLVGHHGKLATLFVRWEQAGAAKLPVFERFPKSELAPESIEAGEREYWMLLATVSIRRLWPIRRDGQARASLQGWIRTLRQGGGR